MKRYSNEEDFIRSLIQEKFFYIFTQMHNVGGQLIAHNCKHQFSIPGNGFRA